MRIGIGDDVNLVCAFRNLLLKTILHGCELPDRYALSGSLVSNDSLPVIGEPITVSWETDPNFLGAFKGALPGHYRYNHRMYGHFVQADMDPGHRGMFLAGDDVSWTPGWAEGAVQTALNAVWGIMTHLGGTTDSANPGPGDVWAERHPVVLPE